MSFGIAEEATSAPKPKKYQGTIYLSGGADQEDAKLIRDVGQEYALQLHLSVKGKPAAPGEVKVKIQNQAGETLVDVPSQGPLFFVKVPGGRYTVAVEHNGHSQAKTFDLVGRRYGQFFFDWAEN